MIRFKKLHLVIVMAFALAVSPPVKATYQDSVILQFLIQSFTYIVEQINRFGFYLEKITKQIGDSALQNAEKQSTEVTSGVIANGTKVLGNIEYALEYAGQMQSTYSNGHSFRVSALSSIACATLEQNKKRVDGEQKAADIDESFRKFIKEFKLPEDITLNEMLIEMKRIEVEMLKEKRQALNVTAPASSISDKDIDTVPQVISMVANKTTIPKDAGHHQEEPGGENSFDLYRKLTSVVESVMADGISTSVSFNDEGSLKNRNKALTTARSSGTYASANNLKTQRGRTLDMVEGQYNLLTVRLEQLAELRKQQQLYTVQALRKLRTWHEEIR